MSLKLKNTVVFKWNILYVRLFFYICSAVYVAQKSTNGFFVSNYCVYAAWNFVLHVWLYLV